MTVPSLKGLVPVLATPFQDDGGLDERSLAELVGFQLASGADAIALFGMASEAFALDREERARIAKIALKEVAGVLPVVAGVGATGLKPAIEQALQAAELGCDVLMVLPPFLVPPRATDLPEFFGRIAESAGLPVMVQDAPDTTRVTLPVSLLAEIGACAGIDYAKVESSPSVPKIAQLVAATRATLKVFGGRNSQFLLDELESGAVGTMPACELTDRLAPILRAWNEGRHEVARREFGALLPLINYGLQPGVAWAVHKEVLVARGIIASSRVRLPAWPMEGATAAGLRSILKPLEGLPEWLWKRRP